MILGVRPFDKSNDAQSGPFGASWKRQGNFSCQEAQAVARLLHDFYFRARGGDRLISR
jgi:hypothetical protein